MSISVKFDTFCTNLRMTTSVVENVSCRYKRITKTLNKEYRNSSSETSNSLYVGSYGRGTAIHVSDIDILYILPFSTYTKFNNYITNGQSALLQEVKGVIETTYNSFMRADGQVIKIKFTDGIIYEIVPCFLNTDNSFTFPDTNNGGSWKKTNPKPEIAEIARANNEDCNSNLKRLCRMVRAWKDEWNVPMGGLLIDTLAHRFLTQWEHRDKSYTYYDWMTRDFFKFLKDQDESQNYWLSPGANQYVWRKGKFEYKALRCYNISLEALAHESKNEDYSANKKWREIYGAKFPN
ncbi:SMODS domain-containing nucleotidyltransferase [Tenacibaculum finnmarkense]|uniref:SMODS domain-containing nucleotidyltransferase n=1 Tax=Tenacibaculum finnmarkense TaxID=2781243 RepID=UPI001E36296A|nr:hypothetical protein [Tenacibaculum finnmarkense]MCD8445679.1 hypothetical protein [Tenacibaculum finnmarkense genomovar ulcerans]